MLNQAALIDKLIGARPGRIADSLHLSIVLCIVRHHEKSPAPTLQADSTLALFL